MWWSNITRFLTEKSRSEIEDILVKCVRREHAKYTSNVYTKVFSGVWPYANHNNNLIRNGVDFNANMTARDIHFQIARFILSEFDIVIILEMWNDTKVQLKCNGLFNDTLPHLNKGDFKKKVGLHLDDLPRLNAEMVALNQYDLKLYEFAKEIALEKAKACRDK